MGVICFLENTRNVGEGGRFDDDSNDQNSEGFYSAVGTAGIRIPKALRRWADRKKKCGG